MPPPNHGSKNLRRAERFGAGADENPPFTPRHTTEVKATQSVSLPSTIIIPIRKVRTTGSMNMVPDEISQSITDYTNRSILTYCKAEFADYNSGSIVST